MIASTYADLPVRRRYSDLHRDGRNFPSSFRHQLAALGVTRVSDPSRPPSSADEESRLLDAVEDLIGPEDLLESGSAHSYEGTHSAIAPASESNGRCGTGRWHQDNGVV